MAVSNELVEEVQPGFNMRREQLITHFMKAFAKKEVSWPVGFSQVQIARYNE